MQSQDTRAFSPADADLFKRAANVMDRAFSVDAGTSVARPSNEQLRDIAVRVFGECDTGTLGVFSPSDAATLEDLATNIRSADSLPDLDRLTPEALRDLQFREDVAAAASRIATEIRSRLA